MFYFLLPKAPKPVSIAPVTAPAAPVPGSKSVASPQAAQPAAPPQPEPQAKSAPKSRARKKEPEMELKPAEPKIIRQ
jgi:hypothetical protein